MESHRLLFALFVTGIFVLAAGCTGTEPAHFNVTVTPLLTVSIQPDITQYRLDMSSAPGIGLNLVVSGAAATANYSYVWKTDYGTFLAWNAPDYLVRTLGNSTTASRKVYWTYGAEESGAARNPVHVTVDITDKTTGAVIGHGAQTIGWDEQGFAVIR